MTLRTNTVLMVSNRSEGSQPDQGYIISQYSSRNTRTGVGLSMLIPSAGNGVFRRPQGEECLFGEIRQRVKNDLHISR